MARWGTTLSRGLRSGGVARRRFCRLTVAPYQAVRCVWIGALIASGIWMGAHPAGATEVEIVLDRKPGMVELYMSLPAEAMVQDMGLPPEQLTGPDGTVDYDPLRLGTWEIGDALFEQVDTRIGETTVLFEAMSLMVHLNELALPLNTPIDGMIAIAVCTAPDPVAPPALSDLRAYAGYIAYTDAPGGSVSLTFRAPLDAAYTFVVRDFFDGRLSASHVIESETGALVIPAASTPQHRARSLVALALAVAIIAGFAAFARFRIRPSRLSAGPHAA